MKTLQQDVVEARQEVSAHEKGDGGSNTGDEGGRGERWGSQEDGTAGESGQKQFNISLLKPDNIRVMHVTLGCTLLSVGNAELLARFRQEGISEKKTHQDCKNTGGRGNLQTQTPSRACPPGN